MEYFVGMLPFLALALLVASIIIKFVKHRKEQKKINSLLNDIEVKDNAE